MNETVLVHHGIEGQKWGQRNGPPYPLTKENLSSAERKADTGKIKRSSLRRRDPLTEAKNLSSEDLKKEAERMELENRYIRALQSQQGKSYVESVASKASTVASIMNSTNSILQFTTGKNFAQLISKKDKENLFKEKVESLELENKYFNNLAKKNERKKHPEKYIDWDTLAEEFAAEFSK